MHRRRVLRAAGLAIGGISLAGCTTDPDEEPTNEPDGSGPTTGETTTRRPTDEIRSTTTTSARSTDEIRSTTTSESTIVGSETPFVSSTEAPPTTGEDDS